jgi:hypothetical protein
MTRVGRILHRVEQINAIFWTVVIVAGVLWWTTSGPRDAWAAEHARQDRNARAGNAALVAVCRSDTTQSDVETITYAALLQTDDSRVSVGGGKVVRSSPVSLQSPRSGSVEEAFDSIDNFQSLADAHHDADFNAALDLQKQLDALGVRWDVWSNYPTPNCNWAGRNP